VRAADYTRALIAAHATHEANQRIANAVRGLLLPGIKRKVIRIEELRNIVAMADAPRTLQRTEGE
jgi:prophage maintenance system killer protein